MTLARPDLRRLLETVLRDDSDLEAFAGDYFPEARKRFAHGMDRNAKLTILLDHAEHSQIEQSLRNAYPDAAPAPPRGKSDRPPPPSARGPLALRRVERFFGRDALAGDLTGILLQPAPAPVCLLGAAGIGKSTLALAVLGRPAIAKRYGARRWFVRLDAAGSAEAAVGLIASALGVPMQGSLWNGIARILAEGPALLVLDNLEPPGKATGARRKRCSGRLPPPAVWRWSFRCGAKSVRQE